MKGNALSNAGQSATSTGPASTHTDGSHGRHQSEGGIVVTTTYHVGEGETQLGSLGSDGKW